MMLDHTSPSQIAMYLRCPRQWEFRYVQGLKIPPTGVMILGSAYDEGLTARFKHTIETQEQPPAELALDTFSAAFERIKSERTIAEEDEFEGLPFDEIDWKGEDPGVLKDMGATLVSLYEKVIAPQIIPVAVQDKKTVVVKDEAGAGIPIVFVPDLETTNKVVDHKVKARRFSADELRQNIQATVYSWQTQKPLDFHVALRTKKPDIQVQETIRTPDDIAWFNQQAKSVWRAVNAGIFPPNDQGWHCSEQWCGYYHLCKGG